MLDLTQQKVLAQDNLPKTCPRLAQNLPPLAQDLPKILFMQDTKLPKSRPGSCLRSWARSWARFGLLDKILASWARSWPLGQDPAILPMNLAQDLFAGHQPIRLQDAVVSKISINIPYNTSFLSHVWNR